MSESLQGQFLIAGKSLRDPTFWKTVVLMVEHGESGAMGLVVNRPSSVTVAHALSEHFELPETDDVVYVGGPVEPEALFVLHNAGTLEQDATPVVPGLYVGSNPDVFEDVVRSAADGNTDMQFRIFSGCAGWSPGQLENEVSRGDWLQHPASTEFILHEDPYACWDELLQKVFETNRFLPHMVKNPELN